MTLCQDYTAFKLYNTALITGVSVNHIDPKDTLTCSV